jgi:tetratricopeptide (TPR) repeat protein
MKKIFFAIISVAYSCSILAQETTEKKSYKDYFTEGSYLMLEDNYSLALQNLKKAYEFDSTNANINFLMGECYLHSATEKSKAEYYLSKAIRKVRKNYRPADYSEKAAPPHAYLYYAQALHINYKFDEAIQYYDKFLEYIGKSAAKEWQSEINYYKNQSLFAKKMVANPINVKLINMGDSINSPYPDFSPVLTADERMLIFTTRRPFVHCSEKTPDGQYFEEIVVSYKDDNDRWSKPVPLSENVNTCGHEASINLTPDGQTLIVYKDENGNGDIYFTQWDGKQWSSLQKFGSDINTEYWETHACLSNDGQTLYFVSDRPGGYGGRDIYRVVKLPNGQWSKALNLGPTINTPYDEDGVFIHPDGKTLFFASKGHQSMGGFDIFFSILDDEGKFSEPFNIGYPINTPDDDVFYVTSPDGKRAYYSSFKDGGYGDKDIYMITIPESQEKNVVLYKGQFIPAAGESLPDDISIVVTDKETGDIVGVYKPQKNGNFVFILKPGKEYNISYEANGEKFYEDEIFADKDATYKEIQKGLELEPIKMLGKVAVKKKEYKTSITVLDHPKTKKPVSTATIAITDNKGNSKNFTLKESDKGAINDIPLLPETKYTITVTSNGITQTQEMQTGKEEQAKIISKVFYLQSASSIPAGEIQLAISVINKKLKKPLQNAKVVLKDLDGKTEEFTTDEKGIATINADKEKKYEVFAISENGNQSNVITLNLSKVKDKTLKKILQIEESVQKISSTTTSPEKPNKKLPASKYEFYFTYLKYAIDTTEEKWIKFIDNITQKSSSRIVNIYIESSASKVPTLMTNPVLAKLRGERLKDKIIKAVEAKGGNTQKLKFHITSKVQGPPCNISKKDQENKRSIYEKYQYVKATAK